VQHLSGNLSVCPATFNDTFCLQCAFKRLLTQRLMIHFFNSQGYYDKPMYHIGVSNLNGFYIIK
ncbi:MAG: hypothetical protein IKJ59_04430, partial [Clostridia bacterium]|nr:hypothetical protein [Clostridia bacterium]